MEKKKDIRFILLFILIVGVSLFYLFQSSYAKYKKQITGDVEATVASWNIKINNESINNKSVLSNYIIPTLDSSEYIKEGVIAPSSTGYFDLLINAEEVDVDFTYEITGTVHEETQLDDLIITEYEQDGIKKTYTEENKITGEIQKNSPNTSIRIYFKWNDDSLSETMDNQSDTEYATNSNNKQTKIKVDIKFTQKK